MPPWCWSPPSAAPLTCGRGGRTLWVGRREPRRGRMTKREADLQLADGRVLRVVDTGPTDGPTVVVCHGTSASRLLHDSWLDVAADAGLRLVCYDRPGYGRSSPQPERIIADTASDVAALADQLRVDRFAVWGSSGGGAHALACGALLADRVVAAAVVTAFA